MTDLSTIIDDYFPANGDTGVPLRTTITILFSTRMDETRLSADFFVQGPDTDQYVGPGLLELGDSDNISQADADDFLASPGYTGIVAGTITFQDISMTNPDEEVEVAPFRTKLIFTPTNILAANTEYTAIMADTLDYAGNEYETPVSFSFTTGSGSIESLPSDVSTSVLSQTQSAAGRTETESTSVVSGGSFEIVKSTPADHSIENDPEKLIEVVVEMNKAIDSTTITSSNVKVKTYPVVDHPNVAVSSSDPDELPTVLEVDGRNIRIKV